MVRSAAQPRVSNHEVPAPPNSVVRMSAATCGSPRRQQVCAHNKECPRRNAQDARRFAGPRPPARAGPASASPSVPSKSRPAAPFHGCRGPFRPADRDFPSARRKITPPDALSRRESSHRTPPATRRATPPLRPRGEVAEWLNAPHSKCGIGASLSGVRIPPSPPFCLEPLIPTASRPVSPPSSPRA